MEINLPDVLAEVKAAFDQYENALMSNDVATLNAMFHEDTRTVRYGSAEKPLWICRNQGVSRRTLPGWFGANSVQNPDHHLWARLRRGIETISPLRGNRWTTDAGVGALSTRLACRRRAHQ